MADQSAADILRANIEAFSAGDQTAFKGTLSDDAIYDELGTQRRVEGAEAVTEVSFGWREAFPDARATIQRISTTEAGAVAEVLWEGTQTGVMEGPGGSIPASGARVRLPASMVATVQGGKITETHHYFDLFSLLSQVGAIPSREGEQ